MRKHLFWILAALFIITLQCVYAESFTGTCTRIIEGDIIAVNRGGSEFIIRIDCIDCPELDQEFGEEARKFTTDLLLNKEVWIDVRRPDKNKRLMARVKACDKDAALEIVKAGYAWYFDKLYKDTTLSVSEKEAREKKRGLWSSDNPVAPWEHRQNKYVASNSQALNNALISKEIVCVGDSDVCYHRPECSKVDKKYYFILKTDAEQISKIPCTECRPDHIFKKKTDDYGVFEAHNPKLGVAPVGASLDATDLVYITYSGMSYHRADCGFLKYSSQSIPVITAKTNGYKPCKICQP
ncbi:MAG: thermonuclease family protein [Candidatus Xenobiia bacterium LiM19]